jgi:methionyl-tRNA synthetase
MDKCYVTILTGTDEHGQKVDKASQEKGRSPKEHADIMVENFRELWERLNISNDAFIRTTDREHIKTVQGVIQMLWDKGEIERREYSGWYCTPDERFWTEKEIIDGNCPECGRLWKARRGNSGRKLFLPDVKVPGKTHYIY